jgi:hypothetical protein
MNAEVSASPPGNRRCRAHTNQHRRCKKQATATVGSQYCRHHRQRYRLEKPDECCICTEPLPDIVRPTKCGHYFHPKCLHNCLHVTNKCPVCRTVLQPAVLQENKEDDRVYLNLNGLTPDGRLLVEVVLENLNSILRQLSET